MGMEKQENNKTETSNANEANVYEIGYLLMPGISNEDILSEVSNIKSILEKRKCVFLSGDEPQMKTLAYPMAKAVDGVKHIFDKAYFAWMKFEIAQEKLADLKKELDKYENILRYLLVNAPKKDTLVSDSKKFSFMKTDKHKVIKPVKIVAAKKTVVVSPADGTEKVSEKNLKAGKQLDETIDKLVIK